MTVEEAMPLITGATEVLAKLIGQIMDSANMSEEQRKQAMGIALSNLGSLSERIKNARFDGKDL